MNRLALFSSFISNEHRHVPRYIFYYLSQIRPHVKTLVYLYNEDFELNAEDKTRLTALVDDIMPVKNEGYDFGMWQKGLRKHNVYDYNELCLLNDSCVCISSLDSFFEWHENKNEIIDITSLTLSDELTRHLQSYFICVKKQAIKVISDWILSVNFAELDYRQIIVAGELGLSLIARFHNFKLLGFYDPVEESNPSLDYAIQMIAHHSPLIKKKALLRNMENNKNNTRFLLTDIIRRHRQLSLEQCHELFDWMPIYYLEQQFYQSKEEI